MAEEWSALSDQGIDRRVREMVQSAGKSTAVLGYFVMDEPGAALFPVLSKVVASLKRHAPGKLAYINLYPNYATIGAPDESQLGTSSYEEYLEQYVAKVEPQFLSYDNYQVLYSDDLRDPVRAARYFSNLLEVRRVALRHHLPWWQVVSSNQIRPTTPVPSPANLLLQAWTTIAAGGRGVGWFTYYGLVYGYAPIDITGHKTATWFYLQMVNRQLRAVGPIVNRLTSTGVYATTLEPHRALPLLPGELVEDAQAATPLMVGEFVDRGGAPYVVVVNLSLERSASVTLSLRRGQIVTAASVEDGRFRPIDAERPIWLPAGQGTILQLAKHPLSPVNQPTNAP